MITIIIIIIIITIIIIIEKMKAIKFPPQVS